MKKVYRLLLVVVVLLTAVSVVSGQQGGVGPTAVPTATPETPEADLVVQDQIARVGIIRLERVVTPVRGFVAIYAVSNGIPSHVVGIALVRPGMSENVPVLIDPTTATTELVARLHVDDGTPAVFDFEPGGDVDAPLGVDGRAIVAPFSLTSVRVFDQRITNNTAVISSVTVGEDAWMTVHVSDGDRAGAVVGWTFVEAGTTPNVRVEFTRDIPLTPTLWAILHEDAGEAGVFEGQFDRPLFINEQVIAIRFIFSGVSTVFDIGGNMIDIGVEDLPFVSVYNQSAGAGQVEGTFATGALNSAGPGFVSVYADNGGHPGKPLGATAVAPGQSVSASVTLDAERLPFPPTTITEDVWTTLHADTGEIGVSEYMSVMATDLPLVVDGLVLTVRASTSGDLVADLADE